jgi:hypothetical protein
MREGDPLFWTSDGATIRVERGAGHLKRTDLTKWAAIEHDCVPVSATGAA